MPLSVQNRRSSLSWSRVVVVLALSVSSRAVSAQQRDTTLLPATVVTATRVPVPATASPATTAVVTGDELRARGVTSVADALRDLPGMTFAESGSYGSVTSLFLRGG